MKRLTAIALSAVALFASTALAGSGGQKYDVARVSAYSSVSYTMTYFAGEDAVVTVEGDGDTDLDVFVYDENGYLIASDEDLSDFCVVSWCPRWTGSFTIVIENLGGVYNEYTLTSN
jgi:hypothetical protein